MTQIRSQIEIDAPAERVWWILADFAAFPQWNPFIRRASDEPMTGARLQRKVQPSGARGMAFRPTVLRAEPNRELR